MVEVIAKHKPVDDTNEVLEPSALHEPGYEYEEPPRSTIDPSSVDILHSVSGDTVDASLIQSDYPRLTGQTGYEYSEPPRGTLVVHEGDQSHDVHHDSVHERHNDHAVHQDSVVVVSTKTEEVKVLVIEDNTELSFKERMKAKKIPDQLNIHSFILMLVGSQNIFLLGSLFFVKICLDLGITSVQEFLMLVWWAPYAALGVYAVIYGVLWKFQRRISVSASSFFLIQIAIGCEAIFLVYANVFVGIDLGFLFCASFQMIACVYCAALCAQCMKGAYTGLIGRITAMIPALVCMALYIAFSETVWDIIIYVMISFFVSLYMWFLITKIDEFVEDLGGRDTMLAGIFCSLLVVKKKIEWIVRIIIFPYTFYLLAQGEKPKPKNPEIIEPLLEHQAKVN